MAHSYRPQASATQRAGRAGRVRRGKCYRMFTEDGFHRELAQSSAPEMQAGILFIDTG